MIIAPLLCGALYFPIILLDYKIVCCLYDRIGVLLPLVRR